MHVEYFMESLAFTFSSTEWLYGWVQSLKPQTRNYTLLWQPDQIMCAVSLHYIKTQISIYICVCNFRNVNMPPRLTAQGLYYLGDLYLREDTATH